ncbi:hypothetical protein Tco_1487659, partial [Tanacetum coccineum]
RITLNILAPKPKVTKEKPSKASTAKPPKPKPAKEKSTKATPLQKAGKAHSEHETEPEHQGEGEEFDMESDIQMKAIRPLLVVEGKGKTIVTEEQAAQSLLALHTPKRRSTTDQFVGFKRLQDILRVTAAQLFWNRPTQLSFNKLNDILGADEILMNNSQPIGSQEPTDEVPAQASAPAPIIRRESERLKLINFNKPLSPGLTKDDAMLAY